RNKIRHRVKRICQVIIRHRDGSSTPEYDRLEVTNDAHGHIDDLVATSEPYPEDEESLCRAIFDLICCCGRASSTYWCPPQLMMDLFM
ncbi:hypothetical protein PAXRUDRAFT_158272, partial [Paxillus rubicundulus Ve08.2h10]